MWATICCLPGCISRNWNQHFTVRHRHSNTPTRPATADITTLLGSLVSQSNGASQNLENRTFRRGAGVWRGRQDAARGPTASVAAVMAQVPGSLPPHATPHRAAGLPAGASPDPVGHLENEPCSGGRSCSLICPCLSMKQNILEERKQEDDLHGMHGPAAAHIPPAASSLCSLPSFLSQSCVYPAVLRPDGALLISQVATMSHSPSGAWHLLPAISQPPWVPDLLAGGRLSPPH